MLPKKTCIERDCIMSSRSKREYLEAIYLRYKSASRKKNLNKLYTTEWRLFHNFFCPSVKLIEKQRIASKTIKRYDNPKTPYQRVMDLPNLTPSTKRSLTELFKELNPFHLRKAMEEKLKKIFVVYYKNSR
jgi:hypothetical protein